MAPKTFTINHRLYGKGGPVVRARALRIVFMNGHELRWSCSKRWSTVREMRRAIAKELLHQRSLISISAAFQMVAIPEALDDDVVLCESCSETAIFFVTMLAPPRWSDVETQTRNILAHANFDQNILADADLTFNYIKKTLEDTMGYQPGAFDSFRPQLEKLILEIPFDID